MYNHIWFPLTVLLWLLFCYHNLCIHAQSEVAIGAYRTFEKTSFSCSGRPSGYYADVETGCQVYHMCDGLGRQFSYSCPNTTLFQQRMLICDHWYMVNCSKAESDYTANLLIGQRDKPFVNDEAAILRTPRPDLLDRPYAPDYSGESFRLQYQKSLQPLFNVIYDSGHNKIRDKTKTYESHHNYGQQRWKIPPPSREILPPAFEPQVEEVEINKFTFRKTAVTTRKPITTFTSAKTKFNYGADALHQRPDYQHIQYDNDDLGTSHSTRYNTSADFNAAVDIRTTKTKVKAQHQNKSVYNAVQTTTKRPTTLTTKIKTTLTTATPKTYKSTVNSNNVKVPSKIYEPPLFHPMHNIEEQFTTATRPIIRPSTSAPFSTRNPVHTTVKPSTKPTTMAGKPFTRSSSSPFSPRTNFQQQHVNVSTLSKDIRTIAPAHGFHPPTTPIPTKTVFPKTYNGVEIPSKALLPPLQDFITHDVATTQGPPIYYEWKVPSDGLEPPILDAPIGVNGREYPDNNVDYNTLYAGKTNNTKIGFKNVNSTRTETKPYFFNIFKSSASDKKTPDTVTQPKTAASIKTPTARLPPAQSVGSETKTDISEIRKEWSVPEYAFPLESGGRTGYLSSDVYNSFQLKIPDGHNEADEHIHWFGENPKCPECHPSYVKPGTCQPCVRR